MKMLQKSMLAQRGEIEHTRTEMRVMASLDNPFIAKLHFSFHTESHLYFVMDFINGGELWQVISFFGFFLDLPRVFFSADKNFQHLCKDQYFSEDRTKFYTAEIILGIQYLHKNGIIYRDLKPENVLLDKDGKWWLAEECELISLLGHIVLVDFGLSKQGLRDNDASTVCCFTLKISKFQNFMQKKSFFFHPMRQNSNFQNCFKISLIFFRLRFVERLSTLHPKFWRVNRTLRQLTGGA